MISGSGQYTPGNIWGIFNVITCFNRFILFPILQVDNSGQYVPQFGNDGPGPIPYVHVGIPPIPYIPDSQGQYYGPSAPPYLDGA